MARNQIVATLTVAFACGGGSGGDDTSSDGGSQDGGESSGSAPGSSDDGGTSHDGASSSSNASSDSGSSVGTTSASGSGTTSGGVPDGVPFVYVGSDDDRIHVFMMDPQDGALTAAAAPVDAGPGPSFLAANPKRTHLYATNETGNFGGMPTGGVAALEIDPATGALTLLNRVSSEGRGPAYVATDRTGDYVLVANYTEGNVAVIAVESDGSLGTNVSTDGGGSQAHLIMPDAANEFVFVPHKGTDSIWQYSFDDATGQLTPNAQPQVPTASGAGPRHMDFHPSGSFAFVINELDDTLNAYTYDASAGQLREIQSLTTLPGGFNGANNTCADVHVHPSGRFVYGSNRGHDSIVVYAIDEGTGMLSFVEHEPTGGNGPRNFEIDPGGTLMLVANRGSDNIVSFLIDPATGELDPSPAAPTDVNSPPYVAVFSGTAARDSGSSSSPQRNRAAAARIVSSCLQKAKRTRPAPCSACS